MHYVSPFEQTEIFTVSQSAKSHTEAIKPSLLEAF